MTLLRNKPNPTLQGHKLVVLAAWDPPAGYAAKLQADFPDLVVVIHKLASPTWTYSHEDIPEHVWEGATILLTFNVLPAPAEAPALQYVQLQSAGANHILQNPLFADTEVDFCTANGVHG